MNQVSLRKDIVPSLLTGLLVLIASIAVLYATSKWGPALSNDACAYLIAAETLATGHGQLTPGITGMIPLATWPPLFPAVLAGIRMFGCDIFQAGRYFNSFLLVLNCMLIGRLVYQATGRLSPAALASAVFASSVPVLIAHSHIWSEPLFLSFTLLSLSFLAKYCQKPSLAYAICFGIAVGLSCMTRYAGLSVAFTGIIIILVFGSGSIQRRGFHTIAATLLGILPVTLWFFRNFLATGNAASRHIVLRVPTIADIKNLFSDISIWLLPRDIPLFVRAAVLAIAVGALLWLVAASLRALRERTAGSIPIIILTFVACYEVVILLTSCVFDPAIFADGRIQIPALAATLVLVFFLVPFAMSARNCSYFNTGAVVFVIFCISTAIVWCNDAHRNGQTLTTKSLNESALIAAIKSLPGNVTISTNAPSLVYAQTRRIAYRLPSGTDSVGRPYPGYQQDMQLLNDAMALKPWAIAFFTFNKDSRGSAEIVAIQQVLRVKIVHCESDGIIMQ
jgi:hypothetical protein